MVLVGGFNYINASSKRGAGDIFLDDVTEYGESGLVRELPKLNAGRLGAACGAVGQVRRVECSAISM